MTTRVACKPNNNLEIYKLDEFILSKIKHFNLMIILEKVEFLWGEFFPFKDLF